MNYKLLEKYLKNIAGRTSRSDNCVPLGYFDPYEIFINIDDAYDGGCEEGEIILARELLDKFFADEHDQ